MNQNTRADEAQYDALAAWLAKLVVFLTMVVIVAGSLVTGYKAALSDPTWPTFVGHWYPMYWVGGLMYEDGHRVTVSILTLATLALTIVVRRREKRPGLRKMAVWAFVLLIVQALIGGVIIRWLRQVPASMLHATAAQLFFCVVTGMALVTSKGWFQLQEVRRVLMPVMDAAPGTRERGRALARLALVLSGMTVLQIVLGAGVRHGDRVHDAFFWTCLAMHFLNWTGIVFMGGSLNAQIRGLGELACPLRVPANAAVGLVMLQFVLGFLSFFANRGRLTPGVPPPHEVAISSTHLAVAGVLLGCFVVLTLRARYLFREEPLAPGADSDFATARLPASGEILS